MSREKEPPNCVELDAYRPRPSVEAPDMFAHVCKTVAEREAFEAGFALGWRQGTRNEQALQSVAMYQAKRAIARESGS